MTERSTKEKKEENDDDSDSSDSDDEAVKKRKAKARAAAEEKKREDDKIRQQLWARAQRLMKRVRKAASAKDIRDGLNAVSTLGLLLLLIGPIGC